MPSKAYTVVKVSTIRREVEAEVAEAEVAEAFVFAKESEFPKAEDLREYVFKE